MPIKWAKERVGFWENKSGNRKKNDDMGSLEESQRETEMRRRMREERDRERERERERDELVVRPNLITDRSHCLSCANDGQRREMDFKKLS